MIVTESDAIFFHFDRAGMMYSDKFNFHDDPTNFIRFVLGLASDEEHLGFDRSIYWKNGKRYIESYDGDKKRRAFELVEPAPFFYRLTIIGRASCVWRVKHRRKVYIVKESWRKISREPEWVFMEYALGMEGVAQMYSHHEDTRLITAIRGLDPESDAAQGFSGSDKIWSRFMAEYYDGGRLEDFESESQLLCAFLDIVEGLSTPISRITTSNLDTRTPKSMEEEDSTP